MHPKDTMLESGPDAAARYVQIGTEAVENLGEALQGAGRSWNDAGSVLDFGCGFGRVLRFLVQKVPAEKLTAADIDPEAIAFVASEFGVTPVLADPEIAGLQLARYDLVWMGSVLTHLSEAYLRALLEKLSTSLNPGGVLAFTTHGQYSLNNIGRYGRNGEYLGRAGEIRQRVAERGIIYFPYHGNTQNYGLTWTSDAFVRSAVLAALGEGGQLISFKPQGWDQHQDFYAFAKK